MLPDLYHGGRDLAATLGSSGFALPGASRRDCTIKGGAASRKVILVLHLSNRGGSCNTHIATNLDIIQQLVNFITLVIFLFKVR